MAARSGAVAAINGTFLKLMAGDRSHGIL